MVNYMAESELEWQKLSCQFTLFALEKLNKELHIDAWVVAMDQCGSGAAEQVSL